MGKWGDHSGCVFPHMYHHDPLSLETRDPLSLETRDPLSLETRELRCSVG